MERKVKVTTVERGLAPVIDLRPFGNMVHLGNDQALYFEEEGPFVIVSVDRWQRLFRHAVRTEQTTMRN